MKKRLKEMEEEAAALRDMQAKVEKEMGGSQGSNSLTCPDLRVSWRIQRACVNIHFFVRM